MKPFNALFNAQLEKRQALGHLRTLARPQHSIQYDFSHNDYLNLSQHPLMQDVKKQDNVHSGSRLLLKNQYAFTSLEKQIAQDLGTEEAILIASGFQANISILSCILSPQYLKQVPYVCSDRMIHASMHLGCQLAGVKQHRYRHCDVEHLDHCLQKAPKEAPKFILTQSLFGMSGSKADIDTLIAIANRHDAFLYIDEAHAVGVYGPSGFGFCAQKQGIDMMMGTFSKGLGCFGAYIGCSLVLKNYLLNFCQGLIYSSAPSPLMLNQMHIAWQLVPDFEKERSHIQEMASYLKQQLRNQGWEIIHSDTHVISIPCTSLEHANRLYQKLSQHHIAANLIRPPSIPPSQYWLRLAIHAQIDERAILALLSVLKKYV